MLFLTMANAGYLELTENLIANFQQSYMLRHDLIVECLDTETNAILSVCNHSNINLMNSLSCSSHPQFYDYNSEGFRRIVSLKFPLLCLHLRRGQGHLWFTDSDIAYLRDPEPCVTKDWDVITQTDEQSEEAYYGTNQCTGSMLVNSNSKSLAFFESIRDFHAQHPDLNDQEAFGAFLVSKKIVDVRNLETCKFNILNPTLFPSGYKAFWSGVTLDPQTVAVHANFLIGKDAKRAALIRCGGWFL